MKRFLAILLFLPVSAFGTYTEFYCQNGGSNLNAGSTTNNTAAYTSNGGNWTNTTRVFTVTDGTNPSLSVNVGDMGSVYVTAGATATGFVGRISTVQNATNGTVTFATGAFMGVNPSNGTGTMTLKVGGAWKGPNAAVSFPTSVQNIAAAKNTAGNSVRINLKNDQTYSMTATWNGSTIGSPYVVQGYTANPGDLGKATIDGGTSVAQLLTNFAQYVIFADLIITTSFTTTTAALVASNTGQIFERCVLKGGRGNGLQLASQGQAIECEVYDCNKSNAASNAGIYATQNNYIYRTIVHGCTSGANAAGMIINSVATVVKDCVISGNAGNGISITGGATSVIANTDFYSNTGDAINIGASVLSNVWIENCNFIKNGGAAINNVSVAAGYVYNCGYGSGTQANGTGDTLGQLEQFGTVTYASGATPWVDPANLFFSINLPAAEGTGRGAFIETGLPTPTPTASPFTIGYPDIGAAQAQIGTAFPTPTATATYTPTPTPTATATATPTPTAPIETSYTFGQ